MVLISAVIVTYNNAEVLARSLDSVLQEDTSDVEVIVVDNNSTDGSIDLWELHRGALRWIRSSKNGGYSYAVNLGVAEARGQYVAVLNDDVITSGRTLISLVESLRRREGVAMIAPRLTRPDGSTQWTCRELPSLRGEIADLLGLASVLPEGLGGYLLGPWGHKTSRAVEQAAGAALVISKEDFVAAGGFDENYPLYFEDVDFCRRVRALGALYYDHEITMTHVGEATASHFRARTTAAIATGRYRYFVNNHSPAKAGAIRILGLLRALSRAGVFGFRGALLRRSQDRERSAAYVYAFRALLGSPLDYDPLEGSR
ncbi:glycosyltransferase family 2 protein [Cryobacterium sp. M91]|uniref:glycosyltransferase family 2 protein n=1 Tax=Cryobacterium sp. M91 TaxID=2048294 RepID=UPI000CE3818A